MEISIVDWMIFLCIGDYFGRDLGVERLRPSMLGEIQEPYLATPYRLTHDCLFSYTRFHSKEGFFIQLFSSLKSTYFGNGFITPIWLDKLTMEQ
jgi:hypothetical protein